jgi:predicted nucleic acid-binding protein
MKAMIRSTTLLSEDLQDGQTIEGGLVIRNPFG